MQSLSLEKIFFALALALVAFAVIPKVVGDYEAAYQAGIWNTGQIRHWSGPYNAHTVVVDDDFEIVSVESDPSWLGVRCHGDHLYEYLFIQQTEAKDEFAAVDPKSLPETTIEQARQQIQALRSSPEFLHRQGRTPNTPL